MSTEPVLSEQEEHHHPKHMHRGSGGSGSSPVYGLGMIGAWMFYFKGATTPKERVQAFCKGLVWPVFLVHDLMVFLKKE